MLYNYLNYNYITTQFSENIFSIKITEKKTNSDTISQKIQLGYLNHTLISDSVTPKSRFDI